MHVSGLGQMLNPLSTCFASAGVQGLVAMEVDLHLDGSVTRGAQERTLDQEMPKLFGLRRNPAQAP